MLLLLLFFLACLPVVVLLLLLVVLPPGHVPHEGVGCALGQARQQRQVEDGVGTQRGGEHEAGQGREDGAACPEGGSMSIKNWVNT